MRKLRKVLHRPRDKSQWENPTKSIGDAIGAARDGKCTYWEAIGPAREVWKELGPNIQNCIENAACEYGSALSVELYMFGSTRDTAAPQVLVCSMEPRVRRQVLKAVETIMNDYPAIGLGEISQLSDLLPVPLALDDIESDFPSSLSLGDGTVVLTAAQDKPFGRRLFIPKQGGSFLRPATAGPILYINGKVYQLTVGHAFLDIGDSPLSQDQPANLEQRPVDGFKSTEDSNSKVKLRSTSKSNPVTGVAWTGNAISTSSQGSSSSAPESSTLLTTPRQPSLDSGVGLTHEDISAANCNLHNSILPRKLNALGKLALLSNTSNPKSPDYGLVELGEAYRQDRNEIPRAANGNQIFLQVRRPAKDPRDGKVITVTGSSGLMIGRLCATASYVRFPNQRTLQELYPVHLEGKLANGDCGSGVVDQGTGHLYGHIVAGTAGTGRAYIVPVEHVFLDIQRRFGGGEVTLIPPGEILEFTSEEKLKLSTLHKPDYSKCVDPLRVVEFASEDYFKNLTQPTTSMADWDKVDTSRPTLKSAVARRLPNGHLVTGKSDERSIHSVQVLAQKQKSATRPKFPRSITGSLTHITALESRLSTAKKDLKGKGKEKNDVGQWNKSKILPFDEHFFALPSDLQVHVVSYLSLPDILSVRLTSKNWHEFVSTNETPISRAFLEHNPVPRFAIGLYPLPASPDLNLDYISGLWHRLSVTSKLSTLMTDWITTDIFLRKDDVQQTDFMPQQARIRRRLIPLLFTIFHFFETYRHLHLKHLLGNDHKLHPEGWKFNPVDRKIMNMYHNETLLQVHQIFPFLVAYLDRKLRPPSFFAPLERFIRGYVRGSLSEHVHVGILCIGGLREVTRFTEIENYDARRTAVANWYASVSQESMGSVPQSRRWAKSLRQKQSTQASSNAAVEDRTNTASTSDDIQHLSSSQDNHGDTAGANSDSKQNTNPKPLTAMPMPPLSPEHARLLIPDLPALEQIWVPTAEALLLFRQAVERKQDIKRNGQSMHELILEEFTAADELFYGRTAEDVNQSGVSLGWGDVLGDIVDEKILGSGRDMLETSNNVKEETTCSI